MREHAQIEDKIAFVGRGNFFQMWEPEKFAQYRQQVRDRLLAKRADGVKVGVTGAGASGAFRWSDAEGALSGNFAPDAVAGLTVPEGDMVSDIHGSSAYRANLVKVVTKRAVKKALSH